MEIASLSGFTLRTHGLPAAMYPKTFEGTTGVLMVFFIMLLFLFIAYKVINKIFTEEEEFVKLILVGLISLIILQTLIHIGVNVRLFPTTGMTLPFLSYGGSSLIGSSIIAGVILNFTRKDTSRYFEND